MLERQSYQVPVAFQGQVKLPRSGAVRGIYRTNMLLTAPHSRVIAEEDTCAGGAIRSLEVVRHSAAGLQRSLGTA